MKSTSLFKVVRLHTRAWNRWGESGPSDLRARRVQDCVSIVPVPAHHTTAITTPAFLRVDIGATAPTNGSVRTPAGNSEAYCSHAALARSTIGPNHTRWRSQAPIIQRGTTTQLASPHRAASRPEQRLQAQGQRECAQPHRPARSDGANGWR